MLGKNLNQEALSIYSSYFKRNNLYFDAYNIFLKFARAEKTGVINGIQVYNGAFVKVKGNIFVPVTLYKPIVGELMSNLVKYKRHAEKIKKYYVNEHYNDIESLFVSGDNFIALPHVLALWPDYNLIKHYYNGFSLEKIDQILWTYFMFNKKPNIHKDPMFLFYRIKPDNSPEIFNKRRFNLAMFFQMLDISMMPLIYQDGALITYTKTILKDLSIYNKTTSKEVVKTAVKKITNTSIALEELFQVKNMSKIRLNTFMFPYTLILGKTDYGYVLNVFKFDLETLRHKLVLSRPVYKQLVQKKENLKGIEFDVDLIARTVGSFNMSFVFTGIDNEYIYFYPLTKELHIRVKDLKLEKEYPFIVKLPINSLEYAVINGDKLTIKKDGKTIILHFPDHDIRNCVIKRRISLWQSNNLHKKVNKI